MLKTLACIVVLGGLFTASACNNQPAAPVPSKSEKIATAFCECTAQIGELNQQAEVIYQDSTRQEEFKQLLKVMEAAMESARECTAPLIGQYGRLNAADLNELQKQVDLKCPAMAGQKDLTRELLGE